MKIIIEEGGIIPLIDNKLLRSQVNTLRHLYTGQVNELRLLYTGDKND